MSRVAHLLNSRREVWRKERVSDGGGGWITEYVQVGSVRTRVCQPSARERQSADQSFAELTHIAYVNPGTDIRREDQLRATGAHPLEVLSTFEPSEPGTYLRADCTSNLGGGSSGS